MTYMALVVGVMLSTLQMTIGSLALLIIQSEIIATDPFTALIPLALTPAGVWLLRDIHGQSDSIAELSNRLLLYMAPISVTQPLVNISSILYFIVIYFLIYVYYHLILIFKISQ